MLFFLQSDRVWSIISVSDFVFLVFKSFSFSVSCSSAIFIITARVPLSITFCGLLEVCSKTNLQSRENPKTLIFFERRAPRILRNAFSVSNVLISGTSINILSFPLFASSEALLYIYVVFPVPLFPKTNRSILILHLKNLKHNLEYEYNISYLMCH